MPMSLADLMRAMLNRSAMPPADREAQEPEVEDAEAWPIPAEAITVHVVAQHAQVRLDKGRLSVAQDGRAPTEVRLDDVGALVLHGATSVTTPALHAVMRRGVPVLWLGFDGRLIGQTLGLAGQPTAVREAQYRACADRETTLAIARALVAAKVANGRRILVRRFGSSDEAARDIAALARKIDAAEGLDMLRGLEGAAARRLWGAWSRMLDPRRPHLALTARSRRPPRDPANAALSYLYAILHGRCLAAAVAAGLDPMAGFLHERRAGRAALALDLMEPFRPLLVEGPLIAAFNNGEFPETAFEREGDTCRLNGDGRRAALALFERRLAQRVSGETASAGGRSVYRDAVTGQARSLAQALRHGRPFEAFRPVR